MLCSVALRRARGLKHIRLERIFYKSRVQPTRSGRGFCLIPPGRLYYRVRTNHLPVKAVDLNAIVNLPLCF